jgi:hypothetical protein
MANLSPTTVAINTIAQCLANAASAARELDSSISDDLRSLLRVALSEADRVRKASRKAAAAAKREGSKPEKKSSTRTRSVEQAPAPKQKGRRKAAAANGVVAH